MMSLNRYRLKHLVNNKHRSAIKASRLLDRPDRLIGVILIGNNFVNIFASAIATVIATRLWGDAGLAIATVGLTIIILIFAEVTPKTLAALHPEKIAFPASYLLTPLLKLLYPFVWVVNIITNGILKLLGIQVDSSNNHHLSNEELRTLVNEAGAFLPKSKQSMLLGVLELTDGTVEDVMVPRSDIHGIDLEQDIDTILDTLANASHTRLPVYEGDINQVVGTLHMRSLCKLVQQPSISKASLLQMIDEPYFVPESTPLQTQLLNFQKDNRHMGLVVDEYGDIQGLATLEDILEEIVGEFSEAQRDDGREINEQQDGTHIIEGSAFIRDINKSLDWQLPTDGPKTLNGLVMEILEAIPEANVCLEVDGYRIETLQISDNQIKSARISFIGRPDQDDEP